MNSYDSRDPEVNLEVCPAPRNAGATDCGVADYLQTDDLVTMRCWVDTAAPKQTPPPGQRYTSPRWFFVNAVNGPNPGYSDYVYSELVEVNTQTVTPACTPAILAKYQDPRYGSPPPLVFNVVGSCTTSGGTLTSDSANFTPGAQYSISASYPDGSPCPLAHSTGTVSATGSVAWQWPCAGDPPGTYTTELVDEGDGQSTGLVHFTIGSAAQASAPTAPGTGQDSSGPTPQPSASAPQPPAGAGLYTEQEGHHGASTFADPNNASGPGPSIAAAVYVHVSCKLYDPSIRSVSPDGYWYRIASSPWNDQYYAAANTFMNGDPWNGPYTHDTDFSVPDC